MNRLLVVDDKARAEVARVVSHAMDHPYYPGRSSMPGDDPCFVAMLDTYRCVFTFTHTNIGVYRQLTVSIPIKDKYPNPVAIFHIADLFGFTGYDIRNEPSKPGDDWLIDIRQNENAVMIAQEAKQP